MVMMILHQYKIKFLSIQSIKWCKLQKLFIKNQDFMRNLNIINNYQVLKNKISIKMIAP